MSKRIMILRDHGTILRMTDEDRKTICAILSKAGYKVWVAKERPKNSKVTRTVVVVEELDANEMLFDEGV